MKCPKCENNLNNKLDSEIFKCELCYQTMCWEHCCLEDQGSDPRCFCYDCYDFLDDQRFFDDSF